MASGGVAQAFNDDHHLQQFYLANVTPTSRGLGSGSYGTVEEVAVQRHGETILCAAKKLHDNLVDQGNEGVSRLARKYQQECQLLSDLHHPNITRFIGLWSSPTTRLPLLVMELLQMSLGSYLDDSSLSLAQKLSILRDVASGLLYLHSKQVIHRDLSANNVLLNLGPPLIAKISDMGNSRIFDSDARVKTLSRIPGTLVYMPPEALDDRHRYGPSLDIFSFGHLALYTIIKRFPCNLLPPTYVDQENPDIIQARSEIERRREYIDAMEEDVGSNHPLVHLVKQCLQNNEQRRPSTEELLPRLQEASQSAVRHEPLQEASQSTVQQHQEQQRVLQFTWRRGPDMPFAMDLYVQSVVVPGKLYAGGGLHEVNHRNNSIVMEYDISLHQWSQLPQYKTSGFAMVAIKEQLVLVGGFGVPSLGVWNGHRWMLDTDSPYPSMPAARRRCSAVVYDKWLVVAGGQSDSSGPSSSVVEVLNTDNHTWHTLSPLPTAFVDMKTAVVGDTCYFMGGCIADSSHRSGLRATDRVFTAHLPNLCSTAASSWQHENVWNEISGVCNRSTPLSLGGSLLAVGGRERQDAIHRYQNGRWEKVGNLLSPRFNCACAFIGDREVAIVGGCDGHSNSKKMDTVTINYT